MQEATGLTIPFEVSRAWDVLEANLHEVGQQDVLKGGGEPLGPGQARAKKFKLLGGRAHARDVSACVRSNQGPGVRTTWITSLPEITLCRCSSKFFSCCYLPRLYD